MDGRFAKMFDEWFMEMTPQEKRLAELVYEYEEKYFADFCFKPESIIEPFVEYKRKHPANGEWVKNRVTLPYEITSLAYSYYRMKVEELDEGVGGMTNVKDRVIIIPPNNIDRKNIVLHEMIHAYLAVLCKSFFSHHREVLFFCLYKDLLRKIPELDERIMFHSCEVNRNRIERRGGEHGILFLLKSLDLDLKCGFKLGTVCGNGHDEFGKQ